MKHSRIEEVTFIFKDRYKGKDYFTPQQFWLRISSDSEQNVRECVNELVNELDGSLLVSYDDPQLADVKKIHDVGGLLNCVIVDTECTEIGNHPHSAAADDHWLRNELVSYFEGFKFPDDSKLDIEILRG